MHWKFYTISTIIAYLFSIDVIWETMHKVGKHDFEIFMASHTGENEEYSEKNYFKSSVLHQGKVFKS